MIDKTLALRFLMGWFDRPEIRLANIAAYDAALNRDRRTVTVRIERHKYWGML